MKKKQPKKPAMTVDQDGFMSDPDAMAPTSQAFDDSLRSLDKLTSLASKGDAQAVDCLHRITCQLAAKLNEQHSGNAKSFSAWPVVLSADREARTEQADKALRLNIGGIEAIRKGAPTKTDYDSESGFALTNLKRFAEARTVLLMLRFGETDQHLDDKARSAFADLTGLLHHDDTLLTAITCLADYSSDTRKDWIGVIVEAMKSNPQLVPEARKNSSMKIHDQPERFKGVHPRDVEWRGGQMKKSLKRALKDIDSIPGYPGH
jgi:hypothetical protein